MAVLVIAFVWVTCVTLLLAGLKHATRVPWWEQALLDIDAVPTTQTPEQLSYEESVSG